MSFYYTAPTGSIEVRISVLLPTYYMAQASDIETREIVKISTDHLIDNVMMGNKLYVSPERFEKLKNDLS